VVDGEAEIIINKNKTDELWSPFAKIWFKEGTDDPIISISKVKPTTACFRDTDGNKMINFFKMIPSVVTGTNLASGMQGELKV
jgi:general stress protein 26